MAVRDLQSIRDKSVEAIVDYKGPASIGAYSLCHVLSQIDCLWADLDLIELLYFIT